MFKKENEKHEWRKTEQAAPSNVYKKIITRIA